jgi:hypothetical protein
MDQLERSQNRKVGIRTEALISPYLRKTFEHLRVLKGHYILVKVAVSVWAVRLFTDFLKACLRLEIGGMEFLFLPAVTKLTLVTFGTTIEVGGNILGGFPVWANLRLVSEKIRLSPEVLPIMSVKANDSIVIIFFVRAPDSLEVKDVKIKVNDIVLN